MTTSSGFDRFLLMKFQAELQADQLKAFACSLDALAGFGEELHIEAKKSQFILWSLNMSLTAQAIIRISPRFFEKYQLKRPVIIGPDNTRSKSSSLTCRVHLKTLRSIFKKNQNIINSLEKCELSLIDEEGSSTDHRLHVRLISKNGVTKTHSLWYGDTEPTRPLYNKDTSFYFSVEPGLLTDFLCYFDPKVFDLALECTANATKVKSYWAESSSALSDERPMHSEFSIQSTDFMEYRIPSPVSIIFNMKEFKTVLSYAEDIHCQLSASFDGPGRAVIFSAKQADNMLADFAVMTHANDQMLSDLHRTSQPPGTSVQSVSTTQRSRSSCGPPQQGIRRTSSSSAQRQAIAHSSPQGHYENARSAAFTEAHDLQPVMGEPGSRVSEYSLTDNMEEEPLFLHEQPRTPVRNTTTAGPASRRHPPSVGGLNQLPVGINAGQTLRNSSPPLEMLGPSSHGPISSDNNQLFAFGSPRHATQERVSRSVAPNHALQQPTHRSRRHEGSNIVLADSDASTDDDLDQPNNKRGRFFHAHS
ncbi:Rad9-domain-containing protein, partial [Radiomyces spectabilis]|uniref:Rad9-domain-containing protein n=1 Tax=Radiomyces spectabilis TaxID=64574 RepID=UPI00221F1310